MNRIDKTFAERPIRYAVRKARLHHFVIRSGTTEYTIPYDRFDGKSQLKTFHLCRHVRILFFRRRLQNDRRIRRLRSVQRPSSGSRYALFIGLNHIPLLFRSTLLLFVALSHRAPTPTPQTRSRPPALTTRWTRTSAHGSFGRGKRCRSNTRLECKHLAPVCDAIQRHLHREAAEAAWVVS